MRAGELSHRLADGLMRGARCIVAAAAFVLCTNAFAALHIQQVKSPSIVDVNLGSLPAMVDSANPQRQARIDEVVQLVAGEVHANPGTMIVLRPMDFPLSYDRLADNVRAQLADTL